MHFQLSCFNHNSAVYLLCKFPDLQFCHLNDKLRKLSSEDFWGRFMLIFVSARRIIMSWLRIH